MPFPKKVILKWLINKILYSVEDYFKIAVYDIEFELLCSIVFTTVSIGILYFHDNKATIRK